MCPYLNTLVQLCMLMLFWAFFSWEERGINWQWWLHLRHNGWPLCHYCFCNCSGTVIACQLSWWHLFAFSMYADLSSYILTGSCPTPVYVLDVVNLVYLLNDQNMILVSCPSIPWSSWTWTILGMWLDVKIRIFLVLEISVLVLNAERQASKK